MRTSSLTVISCSCLVLGLILASALWAQPPGQRGPISGPPGAGGTVTFYADANFRGASQAFDRDVSNLSQTAFGNDRVSSLVVTPGCRVELFSDANFRGVSAVLEGNVPRMDRTAFGNDRASSMRLSCGGGYGGGNGGGYDPPTPRSGVTLYAGPNFSGPSETFLQDDSRLNNNSLGDNRVRSVSVAPGCQATLYDLYDYGGRSVVIDRDVSDLTGTQLGNNAASSVRVQCSARGPGYGNQGGGNYGGNQGGGNYGGNPGGGNYGRPPGHSQQGRGGVTLYADDRFRGASETFYGDVSSFSRSSFGNDRASSLRVDPGCRAVLYSDADFRGRVTVVEFDMGSLQSTEVGNDSVSSMQVDCRGRR